MYKNQLGVHRVYYLSFIVFIIYESIRRRAAANNTMALFHFIYDHKFKNK